MLESSARDERDSVAPARRATSDTLLLLASEQHTSPEAARDRALTASTDAGGRVVAVTDDAKGLLDHATPDEAPGQVDVLAIGEADTQVLGTTVEVTEVVPDQPGSVTETIRARVERALDADAPPVLYVDAVDALVAATSVRHTFGLVDRLTDALAAADATAVVHLDPAQHERSTVLALRTLFDVVLQARADGECEAVETRPAAKPGD